MKSITILKKGATILHDGIVAHTPEGKPVFIVPANLPAPQLDLHPEGMIVYSVPEQQFPPFVVELLGSKERLRISVSAALVRLAEHGLPERNSAERQRTASALTEKERPNSPPSELRARGLDLGAEDAEEQALSELAAGDKTG